MNGKPEVTFTGALSMQVCVPEEWSDVWVRQFAETENPCNTTNGWHIRSQGDELLNGAQERTPCASREGYVHIMLDA